MEIAKIKIEGMESQEEIQLIQQKVNALSGISDISIDTSTQQLGFSYDPSIINLQDVIRSISETGMKAQVIRSKSKLSTWWKKNSNLPSSHAV